MICWNRSVLPNAPELVRPGAWAMNLYFGEMTGIKSDTQAPPSISDLLQDSPPPQVTDFHLVTGVVAQLYQQDGVSSVAWREGGWQYIARNEVTNAPIQQLADQLAALATVDPLIRTVKTGTVQLVRGTHTYTVIDWKVSDAYDEITWSDTPESAIAMARSLVAVPSHR